MRLLEKLYSEPEAIGQDDGDRSDEVAGADEAPATDATTPSPDQHAKEI
jgi:hypothetical protein